MLEVIFILLEWIGYSRPIADDYTFSARWILAPLWIRKNATAVLFSKIDIARDDKPFCIGINQYNFVADAD